MTDYPNRSGEGQSQGTSASQTTGMQSESRSTGLGDIKEKATQDFREIREAAEAQARSALDKSTEMAAEKKNLIAEQLSGVAEALQKVGSEMKNGETAMVGRYAADLGGSAKRLAEDLKNRDMGEIVSMAEDFGRRQPVAFLGLAAIAGLAASRFVMASGSRSRAAARMGEGANTSANPMAGRQTVREVIPTARPTQQAGHSTTGQSSTGATERQGSQAAASSGMGLRTPGVSGAGQSGYGQQSGTTSSQSGFGQGSSASSSSSRPAGGMEATGIGGSGLGTSRDRPASSADTPTLNPSGPNPHPRESGRVQIGETAIGQSSASPAQPNGQSSTRPSNLSSEGRSNV